MKKNTLILAVIILAGFGVWYAISNNHARADSRYHFVEVLRGDLENLVSSTGTLSAVGTVEVGTQVSGIIDKIYVDFNDRVHKGKLLALLDTTLLAVTIRDSEAGVLKARAIYKQARNDHKRNQQLSEQNLISEVQFNNSTTAMESAFASVEEAKAAWQRAKINFKYAFISSPIDGRVISRNVERGQTVAASLSAPILFVIAEDLSEMEILAQVDESDIGQIKEGQNVRFDVQAHPDEIFTGIVRQIRLQPQVVQNVVNYTVVIDAANDKGLLLPGMTATVDFLVEQRQDALLVPNAALRFQPSVEMLEDFRERMRKRFESRSDSTQPRTGRGFRRLGQSAANRGANGFGSRQMPNDVKRVWYLDEDGNLTMTMLRTGATDGKMTEIVRARGIDEGMKLISGIVEKENVEEPSNQRSRRGFGGRPF